MALSRRPARFESQRSMQSRNKTIPPEKLELLRAAAARVYKKDENPRQYSMEAINEPACAAGNEVESENEEDPAHGVKLLAAAAAIEIAGNKKARTKKQIPHSC